MVEIDIAYQGNLHTSCRHGPSGRQLETDAPLDNQGRGESFSPTDLLATALGTCMLTVMGIAARRQGLRFDAAQSRVEKYMVADPVRRVGRLVVRFELPAGFAPEARTMLEEAARTCPVQQSLHPEIETELIFCWK